MCCLWEKKKEKKRSKIQKKNHVKNPLTKKKKNLCAHAQNTKQAALLSVKAWWGRGPFRSHNNTQYPSPPLSRGVDGPNRTNRAVCRPQTKKQGSASRGGGGGRKFSRIVFSLSLRRRRLSSKSQASKNTTRTDCGPEIKVKFLSSHRDAGRDLSVFGEHQGLQLRPVAVAASF